MPEDHYGTPENDDELLAKLEAINAEENPIERAWKLDQFYEEGEVLKLEDAAAQPDNGES